MAEISTKPYLIRALYEWCADNGYRPYIAVAVDERTVVPREFVRDGEIVLNISAVATNRLTIGNELLEFEARFGGVARQVSIPIENISAIFAQENGHGMAFEVHRPPAGEAPPHEEGAGAPARGPSLAAVPREAPAAPSGAAPAPEGGAASRGAPGAAPQASGAATSDVAATPDAASAPPPAPRARRRPKLASVPAPDAGPAKPPRRKAPIAAVPSAPARSPASARDDAAAPAPGPAPADAAPGAQPPAGSGTPPGDEPSPPTPPGRPHLKRVK